MARDKDKKESQEDTMLNTENTPGAPELTKVLNDDDDQVAPDEEFDLKDQMEERDEARAEAFTLLQSRVERLEERLEKREKKRQAEDVGYLVTPVKVIAGLALSAEQLSTFKQTFPYLF